MKMLIKTIFSVVTAFALLPFAAQAGHHEGGDRAVAAEQMGDDVVWASGARAIVAEVEGEVIAVDMETREVVVRGPAGNCHADRARPHAHGWRRRDGKARQRPPWRNHCCCLHRSFGALSQGDLISTLPSSGVSLKPGFCRVFYSHTQRCCIAGK